MCSAVSYVVERLSERRYRRKMVRYDGGQDAVEHTGSEAGLLSFHQRRRVKSRRADISAFNPQHTFGLSPGRIHQAVRS